MLRKIRVLFVCMGNICRSPSAEAVFQHYVDEQGLNARFEIHSAGTIGYHSGAPADPRMRRIAAKRGYSLDSRARQVTLDDLMSFDFVVAMDRDNYQDLKSLGPSKNKISMLGSFLRDVGDDTSDVISVPDPYYGGDAGFEQVLDMLEQACPAMLQHCLDLAQQTLK